MKRQCTHADRTFLPRGHFPKRPDVLLGADIEFASTLIKYLLDWLAFFSVLLPVFVLTFLVAIPNALAGRTLLQGTSLLIARRTQHGHKYLVLRMLSNSSTCSSAADTLFLQLLLKNK